MNDPLARAQEIVEDECIATDEDVEIIRALVEIAKAAREHWEAVRNLTNDEVANSSRCATSPTGVFATLGTLASALSVLDDREAGEPSD